tara:strand:- start:48 stop:809 length:762 start_codon:yes stop_codon:yes gene_type:complete
MKDRYFSVEVKPTLPASKQHAAAFTAGDVLFDYTEFEIPKGTSRLIGATMITRPKGNATPTGNKFGAFLIFSKTNTTGYGTVNSAQTNVPSNDFLGLLELETTTSYSLGAGTAVGMTGRASNTSSQANVLLTGSQTGSSVGYDKLYVAAQANGAFDFTSINAIAESGAADAASTQVITMDGSSMDVRDHFIAGDVVHIGTSAGTPAADSLIGTVASADSATQITLDAVSPTALVDGDILYNIHPIRLILHFEK